MSMIIRLRSSIETKRLNLGTSTNKEHTFGELKACIQTAYSLKGINNIYVSLDSDGQQMILGEESATLSSLGISHGTLLFLRGKLVKTIADKSYVAESGDFVTKGQETFEIVLECEGATKICSAAPQHPTEPITQQEGRVSVSNVASKLAPLIIPQMGPEHLVKEDNDIDTAAGDFQFEESAPSYSVTSPDVRRPDENKRMRLVEDSPMSLPSPFRGVDLSRSLLRDISMQQMLQEIDAATARSQNSQSSSQSALAAGVQARNASHLGLNSASNVAPRNAFLSDTTSTTAHAAVHKSKATNGSELDQHSNPKGTSYAGTMGRSGFDGLRLDDVESADAWDQLQESTGSSTHDSLPRPTERVVSPVIAPIPMSNVDQSVVEALRAAGYSEYDILMELRQQEDEAFAKQLQLQQNEQNFADRDHPASPLAHLLRRSNITGASTQNNSGSSRERTYHGPAHDAHSRQLFSNMHHNFDALSLLQAQSERALEGARALLAGNSIANAPQRIDLTDDEDDLTKLRRDLDRLSQRVHQGTTEKRTEVDEDENLAMAIQASLQDGSSGARRTDHKADSQNKSGKEAVSKARGVSGNARTSAPRPRGETQTTPIVAAGMNNEAAIEQARKRLAVLMNNVDPAVRSGVPTPPVPKGALSSGSRARIDCMLGGNIAGSSIAYDRECGTAPDPLRAVAQRSGAEGSSRKDRNGQSNHAQVASTSQERERNRTGRQARSNARDEFYRDVQTFLHEDLSGGVRSRAAAASVDGRLQGITGASQEDDDLARAIARSMAER